MFLQHIIWILATLCGFKCEQICLSCTGLSEGEFCTSNVRCHHGEVCFLEKYRTADNKILYDVGCAHPQLCQESDIGGLFGKRSTDHAHVLCHSCCNNTLICNANLNCNDHVTVAPQQCVSCSKIDNPRTCNNSITCGNNEVCYAHKYQTDPQHEVYDMGCKHQSYCLHPYTHVFGRRSYNGLHYVCEACCTGKHCNQNITCDSQKALNEVCTELNQCKASLNCINNTCQCGSVQYWNGSLCRQKKAIHESCMGTSECQDSLYCNHGTCKCDSGDHWDGLKCIQRVDINSPCTSSLECMETFNCLNHTCQCIESDYREGNLCYPKKDMNEICKSTHQCKDTFHCINSTCRCNDSEHLDENKCSSKPRECADIQTNTDGVYTIYLDGGRFPVSVYCKMESNKKWTVIQRKTGSTVDFNRTWVEYKTGFGTVGRDHWLGNENIRKISSNGHHEVMFILVTPEGKVGFASYSTFSVGDNQSRYSLTIAGYNGNTSDSMVYHNNMKFGLNGQKFSTWDQDNDNYFKSCAKEAGCGWWFNNCHAACLNGEGVGGMEWTPWNLKISSSMIMIRRV